MNFKHLYLIFCIGASFFTFSASSETTANTVSPKEISEISIDDDEVHILDSKAYPEPYPAESMERILKVDPPYSILIEVKELELDGLSGDFLLIKSGVSSNEEGEGKVFTYFLKTSRNYLFNSNNIYIGLHVLGKNEAKKKGFSITYQRVVYEEIVSTEAPTTVVTWPTPIVNDSIYYTAYVYGKTKDDFNSEKTLNHLKTSIANMAIKYCVENKVTLLKDITSDNVLIDHLNQCPYSWPHSETCIVLRFALPIFQVEKLDWEGYQFKSDHLEAMWTKFATENLAKYDMSVYYEPNNHSNFIKWIAISTSILFILLFMPYAIHIIGKKFQPRNKNLDMSDIMPHEIGNSKLRSSKNPYQTTPQIFDNAAFDEFDFEISLPKKTNIDIYEDNSDDEIVLSHFTNSKNNTDFSRADRETDNWQIKKSM